MENQTVKDVAELTAKECIETNLLHAMKGLDNAIFNICQHLSGNYGKEVDALSNSRTEIKKILNQHFDRLARERHSTVPDKNKQRATEVVPSIKATTEVKKPQKFKFQYWDNFYNVLLGTYYSIEELKANIIAAGGVTPHWKKMQDELDSKGEFIYCDKIYLIKKVKA